ncbi:hypothetical protein K8R03_03390 [Candidatus Kaiserbacteria bacterium]|nr:hypothetical protein [Candidatus Kaiserbacteria bacterium]
MKLSGKRSAAVLAVYVIVAFTGVGPLHSMIQHDDGAEAAADALLMCEAAHGYGHCAAETDKTQSRHESVLWGFIHSSLANEGKKTSGIIPQLLVFDSRALLKESGATPLSAEARAYPDKSERQLSRGIFKYRRFG